MFFCVILIKVAWLAEKQEMPDLFKICQNTHPWIHHSKIYGMKPFISRHARKKMLDRTTKFLTTLASPKEVHSNNNIKISLLCEIAICIDTAKYICQAHVQSMDCPDKHAPML